MKRVVSRRLGVAETAHIDFCSRDSVTLEERLIFYLLFPWLYHTVHMNFQKVQL